MAKSTARAKYIRIAPRKVRLVADLIRGKQVAEARDILNFTTKRAAPIVRKLLDSAAANAEHESEESGGHIDPDEMVVSLVQVDGGPTLRRFRPQPRGRAARIRKRTSHIELSLVGGE